MKAEAFLDLRHRGYAPRSLLDIGAHLGGFTRSMLEVFPGCVPTMVEPNPHCHPELAAMGFELHGVAASNEAGEAELNLTREWPQSTGASLYRENTPFFRDEVLERARIPKATLDALFAGRRFDFVKIDTQGSELDVLRGGQQVLRQADYILVEVSLVEFNQGGAPAEAVFAALAELGFRRAEVKEFHRLRGVMAGNLLQMDFLFEREAPRPSQHLRPSAVLHEAALLAWLAAKGEGFAVIDLGQPCTELRAGASFGLRRQGQAPLHFPGNPNDRAGWEGLLRHVGRNGRFAFALCSHGLRDLAYPAMMLEMLPRVAEAGLVTMPAGAGVGLRWSLGQIGENLLLGSDLRMPAGPAALLPGAGCLHLHWRGALAFDALNEDFQGATSAHAIGRMRHGA